VLEKAAADRCAHALSGAVMEPGPLDELCPNGAAAAGHLRARSATNSPADAQRALPLPVPPQQHNHGNFIVSLGLLTPLARAEGRGARRRRVRRIRRCGARCMAPTAAWPACRSATWASRRTASPGRTSRAGAEVRARVTTVLAEGCRGSVTKVLIGSSKLDRELRSPQTYGLGFKELWQLPKGRVEPGLIQHCIGWPLDGGHLRRQLPLSPRE
jgi:electron-transferring-flavoprotein dehydrogenase